MRAIYVRSIFVVVGLIALAVLEATGPFDVGAAPRPAASSFGATDHPA